MSLLSSKPETDTHAAIPLPDHLRKPERIAILTANGTEDTEFFYPYYRFTEEGYGVDVVTPKGGKIEAKHGLSLQSSRAIHEIRPEEYVLIYIPGGKAPAELRRNEQVTEFVRQFARSHKPIAAICHGPQLLISAGLVHGRRMACWPEVAKELEAAGGIYVNEPSVEDVQFITARMPGDLPRHLYSVLHYLQEYGQSRSVKSAA